MSYDGAVALTVRYEAGEVDRGEVMIFCPGCKCGHVFATKAPNHCGAQWKWNGDRIKPTFEPSMLVSPDSPKSRCHSYVRDGNIEFLSDCWHELKGQIVKLEPF